MKTNHFKSLLALLLCLSMMLSVACSDKSSDDSTPETSTSVYTETEDSEIEDPLLPENGAEKIIEETKTLYLTSENYEELLVAHYESTPEILLIDTDTMYQEFFCGLLSEGASFEYTETEDTLTITRDNGAYCYIDFVVDCIYFDNFDLFTAGRSDSMSDILAFPYVDDEGNDIYFQTTGSIDVVGLPLYLDLAERDIPLDVYNGKKYMPFQTFNDIFLASRFYNFVYNGEDLYMAVSGSIDASLSEQYYSVGPKERSEALAEFTANELCFMLDLYYGLQDEHGVTLGFDFYFDYIGLWDDINSTDPKVASTALYSLTYGYLADKHSTLNMTSPYIGSQSLDQSLAVTDPSIEIFKNFIIEFNTVRQSIMTDGVPPYQEIGNTAYITFDNFTLSNNRAQGYSEASLQIGDTIGLIIYAHSMITREDSPIENVVLDLSCNTGGAVDAGVYVVAWMLGHCDLHLINPNTEGFSTTSYKVDVNLDGTFDSDDTISDKNLYCIISPVSFSCGNLVPSLLKESGRVTLLGGTSGGGACAVQYVSTADGSLFQISSPMHLAVVSNGAYYTVDRGVDPHYYFGKTESYFERNSLTDYINNLR